MPEDLHLELLFPFRVKFFVLEELIVQDSENIYSLFYLPSSGKVWETVLATNEASFEGVYNANTEVQIIKINSNITCGLLSSE